MKARLCTVFILVAGLALTLAWVVAAHQPEPDNTATQTASTPITLNLNLGPTDPTLDPALIGSGSSPVLLAVNQLFAGLTQLNDATSEPLPKLATSWDMSPDAKVFTFTLRSGVTWTDGNPVTAQDVRYGILRSLALDPAGEWAYPLWIIQNAEGYSNGSITDPNLVGVTVLDNSHIRFTLTQAAAFLPEILSLPIARPMPQWAIEAHGTPTWTFPLNIVSSGAYSPMTWTHGVSMTLVKNPGYYDAANVPIEQVVLHMVDDATAWSMYQAGQLDSVYVPQSIWNTGGSLALPWQEYHTAPVYCSFGYGFNTAKAPFTSTLVRQAFAAAVDRQGMISNVLAYVQQPALTFTPPGLFGYVDGMAEGVGIPYSPTLAQQWLAAAGYPNGAGLPPITLVYNASSSNQAVAQYVRQNWTDNLSVTIALSYTNSMQQFRQLLNTDPPQVWRAGWCYDHYDAYNFLNDFIIWGGNGFGNWNNLSYETLLAQATQTADLDIRKALYKQAEEILVETDAVLLPLYYQANAFATKPYLQRTYDDGGYGGRIADWRIVHQVFLPVILKN